MTPPDELGLDTPGLNDLIRDGAGNITTNAQVLAALWDKRWNQPPPAAGTNANSIRKTGAYPIYTGSGITNLPPGAGSGSLLVLPSTDTAVTHLWVEYGSNPQLWARFYAPGPASWGTWRRIDGANKLTNAGFLGVNGDLDTATTPGAHGYWSTDAHAPGPNSGVVWVAPVNTDNNLVQLAIEYGTQPGMYTRFRGTVWSGWTRLDAGASADGGGAGNSPSALKNVPLALSASTATATETVAAGAVRFPFLANAPITRWRLHIRNHNDRTNTNYPAGASFTGLWLGSHAGGGAFASAPSRIVGAFTLPADGSEYVTPWSTAPIGDGTEVLLSLGWTGAAGPNTSSPAGCYRSTSSDTGGQTSSAGYSKSAYAPFSWWIEAETLATTPVVAAWGDSITAGTGNDLVLHDSFLSQYCRRIGALPVHYAYPGTGMSAWTNANSYQWTRWANLARADAVIHFMGQNDLNGAGTLAAMQNLFWATIGHLGAHVSQNIYAATLTPHANKSAAINEVRKQYNAWLKTLPGAARDVFDFNAAVRNATDDALAAWADSGDTLHLSTAGSTAAQATITRPVTTQRTDRDTGYRYLSHPNVSSGTLAIRRVGRDVILSLEGVTLSAGGNLNDLITAGFRPTLGPNGAIYARTVAFFSTNVERNVRVRNLGHLEISAAAAGDVLQLDLRWSTEDPWPTTLPGTPA